MKVAVVIPNWNGIDLIEACLESLEAQTIEHTVIVVDNGSKDGSNKVVRRRFPQALLLEFPNNAGFAGGVNRGIRVALERNFDSIALLNNDAVADPHWLEELVAEAERNAKTGIVAAKILTQDGRRLDSTGDFYSVWGFAYPRGRGEADHGQYDGAGKRRIFAASGGASLYRADMLRAVGLFDERFFAYFEDVDISFRARLEGWEIRYAPAATVRHFIGGTSARLNLQGKSDGGPASPSADQARPSAFARYHTVKNFAYVYIKNMPGGLFWRYFPRFVASEGLMLISDVRRGMVGPNLKAHAVALLNLPGLLRERWRIQRRRTASPAEIDALLVHALPPLQRRRFEELGLVRKARP